jgi:uncharacterized protein (TIGR03435 family)
MNRPREGKAVEKKLLLVASAFAAVTIAPAIFVRSAKAQTKPPEAGLPTFEAISIRPFAPGIRRTPEEQRNWGDATGRVSLYHISPQNILSHIYNLRIDQLSAPAWLNDQEFDILAVVPPGATKEQIPLMFQALLADRFGLKFHWETRTKKVFELVVGKDGPKLKPPLPDDPDWREGGKMTGLGENMVLITRGTGRFGRVTTTQTADGARHLEFASMTMESLVQYFNQPPEVLGLPVVDMTEVKGSYQVNLDISISPGGGPPTVSADGSSQSMGSLMESLHKIGLNLVHREEPIRMLIIDHIDKTPTPN